MFYKQLCFDMALINPGSSGENGSLHPKYVAMNPAGTIPCIEEPESGFSLGEAHAIIPYRAQQHGWTDVNPNDLKQRARIDGFLHYHHRNVREASSGLVAPRIRKDLDIPQARYSAALATLSAALDALDSGWLASSRYVAGNHVTLADFAVYVEIGQLRHEFANLYDFAPFPNVTRWMDDIR